MDAQLDFQRFSYQPFKVAMAVNQAKENFDWQNMKSHGWVRTRIFLRKNDDIWVSSYFSSFHSHFKIGSINLLCLPLGCFLSGMLCEPFGKRRAMQIVSIPMFMAWMLFHFASHVNHLYAGLALAGFGGGLMEAPVSWQLNKKFSLRIY